VSLVRGEEGASVRRFPIRNRFLPPTRAWNPPPMRPGFHSTAQTDGAGGVFISMDRTLAEIARMLAARIHQ